MEKQDFEPNITCFYCINAVEERTERLLAGEGHDIQFVKLACSSMIKDIYLLKAFESGADGVVLIICPENACRYIKGSIRARKRVDWVKGILDQIGVNGNRLFLCNNTISEKKNMAEYFRGIVDKLGQLGPNPANK